MSTGASANESVPPGGSTAQASSVAAPDYAGAEKPTTGTEEVGWYFVEQYYTTLNKSPDQLHLFYSKKSSLVWGLEGEITPMAQGRTEISDKIKNLNFHDCKVRVTNVDSQASIQGGIMVQVLGQMSNNSEPNRRFSQTFFLAEQQNGFYVLNDIFRYLKEEDEEEEVEAPAETTGEETAAEGGQIETFPADEPVVEVVEEKKPDSIETPAEEPVEKKETVPEVEVEEPAVNGKDKAEESAAAPAAAAPAAAEESTPLVVTPAVPVITTPPPPSSARRTPTPQPEKAAEPEEIKPAAAAAAAAAPEEAKAPSPAPQETKAPATNGSGTSTPPVQAAPPKPAAPRTWATLVASSGPKPPVAPAAVSTAGPAAGTSTPPPAASKPPADAAPAANAQGSAPGTPVTPSGGAGGGWQTTESSRRSRPVSMSGPAEGQTQAYIKHVNERVSPGLLKEALSKFGALKHFDVVKQKNCAFVDFADASGFLAAVAANPHKINDQVLYVEERKPRGAGSSYPGGRGDRGGAPGSRGDRGSMGGRGGGFPRSNTGDRFEGGRGGMGGRGQGRGTYPRGGGRGGAAQS